MTKRGFLKWLLSTPCLIGFGGATVSENSLPSKAYIAPQGVSRFTVRMMGGGGGGGSVHQTATGGRGGILR